MSTDPVTPDAIDNWFSFHPATETTGPLHEQIRHVLRETAHELAALLPSSPERTTALNKLREAMTWANTAVACHGGPDDG